MATTAQQQRSWEDRTRIFLSPMAAPSILGLFGFAGATFIVASHVAGWWGDQNSALYLFPFAAAFGGIAQFAAGMFAYRARDGVATAMHGMWGSFWIAYGILHLLYAIGVLDGGSETARMAEGFWFIALAWITFSGAIAALGENVAVAAVLGTLAAGSGLLAAGLVLNNTGVEQAAGWVLVISAFLAWYTATAMMMHEGWSKVMLPLGEYKKKANIPGSEISEPMGYEKGMPGSKVGQ